ncbi:hypothetical protein J4Q44_G00025070 [Coregonus suidteri]|uniref:EF-hand domain-containing protein n=1 Tax=Coregonus suidteri TaxID=861788 RepID=A0AAN8MGS6_9TELE
MTLGLLHLAPAAVHPVPQPCTGPTNVTDADKTLLASTEQDVNLNPTGDCCNSSALARPHEEYARHTTAPTEKTGKQLLRSTLRPYPVLLAAHLCSCINISAVMPSELERSMESLITVFHRYADKDGDSNTLSNKELKELMQTELASFLKSQKDPAAIDKIMKDLDQNGDGKVNFEEFVSLVVGLSIACEQIYQLHILKVAGKK